MHLEGLKGAINVRRYNKRFVGDTNGRHKLRRSIGSCGSSFKSRNDGRLQDNNYYKTLVVAR
jgi:hypothetical protein